MEARDFAARRQRLKSVANSDQLVNQFVFAARRLNPPQCDRSHTSRNIYSTIPYGCSWQPHRHRVGVDVRNLSKTRKAMSTYYPQLPQEPPGQHRDSTVSGAWRLGVAPATDVINLSKTRKAISTFRRSRPEVELRGDCTGERERIHKNSKAYGRLLIFSEFSGQRCRQTNALSAKGRVVCHLNGGQVNCGFTFSRAVTIMGPGGRFYGG